MWVVVDSCLEVFPEHAPFHRVTFEDWNRQLWTFYLVTDRGDELRLSVRVSDFISVGDILSIHLEKDLTKLETK